MGKHIIYISGQIIISHQPSFPWMKGIPLPICNLLGFLVVWPEPCQYRVNQPLGKRVWGASSNQHWRTWYISLCIIYVNIYSFTYIIIIIYIYIFVFWLSTMSVYYKKSFCRNGCSSNVASKRTSCVLTTVDGWNPNNHLGWCWNPINNGKNYQPQLVIAGFQPSTVPLNLEKFHRGSSGRSFLASGFCLAANGPWFVSLGTWGPGGAQMVETSKKLQYIYIYENI